MATADSALWSRPTQEFATALAPSPCAVDEQGDHERRDAESLDFVRGKLKEAMALYPEDLKQAMGWSDAMFEAQLRTIISPWFMLLSQYDPLEALPAVKCPVLALFGAKDTQVAAAPNAAGMKAALDAGGNRDVTLKTFPDLNHLFNTRRAAPPPNTARSRRRCRPR